MNTYLNNLKLKLTRNPTIIQILHWEYWSFGVIYSPIYFYWFYLCLRERSFFFFSSANPTIKNGGFLMECKSDVYQLIPAAFYPKTTLIEQGQTTTTIINQLTKEQFQFPIIIKPDIGCRGRGVKKIYNMEDAATYILQCDFPMLAQEFIDYEEEAGIFYYRYPWQEKGHISGIVTKKFFKITGDGFSTIEQLMLQNKRYILQLKDVRKMAEIDLQLILKNGEEKIILPYGNHARGAKFEDAFKQINPKLQQCIDNICKQISGFYYGRLDIKFSNWNDLHEGKNFSIIELNGAGSEPTHMYDPQHTVFFCMERNYPSLDNFRTH